MALVFPIEEFAEPTCEGPAVGRVLQYVPGHHGNVFAAIFQVHLSLLIRHYITHEEGAQGSFLTGAFGLGTPVSQEAFKGQHIKRVGDITVVEIRGFGKAQEEVGCPFGSPGEHHPGQVAPFIVFGLVQELAVVNAVGAGWQYIAAIQFAGNDLPFKIAYAGVQRADGIDGSVQETGGIAAHDECIAVSGPPP